MHGLSFPEGPSPTTPYFSDSWHWLMNNPPASQPQLTHWTVHTMLVLLSPSLSPQPFCPVLMKWCRGPNLDAPAGRVGCWKGWCEGWGAFSTSRGLTYPELLPQGGLGGMVERGGNTGLGAPQLCPQGSFCPGACTHSTHHPALGAGGRGPSPEACAAPAPCRGSAS